MQNIQTLLDNHDTYKSARERAHGKTWQIIYDTCDRGEWLTWLLSRSAPALDKHTRVKLAAALVNTVRDLMPDAAKEALDVAIRYGNGDATDKELKVAAEAAWSASRAAWAVEGAVEAAVAALTAARAATAAARAVEGAAWEAAWAVTAGAAIDPQLASIVREIIPIEYFNIDPNSTYNNQ
jgi:hypothetical protein